MFESIDRLKPDQILGLMAQFRADSFREKVDLGVGVYRDPSGNTPVLECVRRAEQLVLASQTTKSYVAAAGREEFNAAVEDPGARRLTTRRARCAARTHRAGARRLRRPARRRRARPRGRTRRRRSIVSDPTWGNHAPLLGSSGLRLERYPYYDAGRARAALRCDARAVGAGAGGRRRAGACLLPQPVGADLSLDQWRALTDLLQRRRLVPFLDLAYQGFGTDLDGRCGRTAAGCRGVCRKRSSPCPTRRIWACTASASAR